MAHITLAGNPVTTTGQLPKVGTIAPAFQLLSKDLSIINLDHYKGKNIILNIFPSIDTDVCATSVRNFNERATQLENTVVVNVSRDTPFALNRFKKQEDLEHITNLSDCTTGQFGKDYGLEISSGPLTGFHSRAVIIIDKNSSVIYTEQVSEIGQEPNYLQALTALIS